MAAAAHRRRWLAVVGESRLSSLKALAPLFVDGAARRRPTKSCAVIFDARRRWRPRMTWRRQELAPSASLASTRISHGWREGLMRHRPIQPRRRGANNRCRRRRSCAAAADTDGLAHRRNMMIIAAASAIAYLSSPTSSRLSLVRTPEEAASVASMRAHPRSVISAAFYRRLCLAAHSST